MRSRRGSCEQRDLTQSSFGDPNDTIALRASDLNNANTTDLTLAYPKAFDNHQQFVIFIIIFKCYSRGASITNFCHLIQALIEPFVRLSHL